MSIKSKLTNFIKSCKYRNISQFFYSFLYSKQYQKNAKRNGIQMKDLPTSEFKRKWSQLSHVYETTTFQYFANYTEHLSDIVPESIGRTCIEYILNPINFRAYYSDKNMFARICGNENIANTLVCRIGGGVLLDKNLKPISSIDTVLKNYEKVILKPTFGSKGGQGIMVFCREGNCLKSDDVILSETMLLNYGENFAIQEVIQQNDKLASLNPTSVNTIRVAVYRSVVDDKAHVISSIIRIGGAGMVVDNACSGGKYAGVDIKTGKIANTLRDINGKIYTSQNGIDYTTLDFTIPGWEIIKNKCQEIAENIPHHRLIAFDMTITNDLKPIMIEFNINAFSYWLFMYTNQPPLGNYTEEIIEYCKKKLKKH